MTVAMAAAGLTSASTASSNIASSGVQSGVFVARSFNSFSNDLTAVHLNAVAAVVADADDEAVAQLTNTPRFELYGNAQTSERLRDAALAAYSWADSIDDALDDDTAACDAWLDGEIDETLHDLTAELALA
jgi:hypothetical protein